jgi:hypothetical protein
MTLRILATGLLAATIMTGTSTLAAAQSQSTDCDLKQSTASQSAERVQETRMPTRDDWVRWAKAEAAKPTPPAAAEPATKLDEPQKGLLKQEKAETTESAAPSKVTADEASTTTGRASPGDRARKGADGSEAEATTLADKSASSIAQSGSAGSGTRMGGESRADAGNPAGGGMDESKSAERPTDC